MHCPSTRAGRLQMVNQPRVPGDSLDAKIVGDEGEEYNSPTDHGVAERSINHQCARPQAWVAILVTIAGNDVVHRSRRQRVYKCPLRGPADGNRSSIDSHCFD